MPAAGVPVGVPEVNVVLDAVTALSVILCPTVAPHGRSAVIKIYPVPTGMLCDVNDGKVNVADATAGDVSVERSVAVEALKLLVLEYHAFRLVKSAPEAAYVLLLPDVVVTLSPVRVALVVATVTPKLYIGFDTDPAAILPAAILLVTNVMVGVSVGATLKI